MLVETVSFVLDEKEEKCAFAVVDDIANFCFENLEELLSLDELEKLNSIGSEKRKKQYCLGRITTKTALNLLTGGLEFQKVNVTNEKSGWPIIENSDYATSITHTDEVAASLVFKKEFSFGIDVEKLRENSIEALKFVTFDRERIPDDLESLTAAWTLKESLSKALKRGFTLPFEEFELSKFFRNGDVFHCSYEKYPEFQGVAQIVGNNSYAITHQTSADMIPNLTPNRPL